MDSRPVPPQYLKAGQDYLDALASLGMNPHYLGWGWERANEQWLLVLVTSIVDAGGPLALNRLLFKAYNAKATPREISPFIVRVFSPEVIPPDFWIFGSSKNMRIRRVRTAAGEDDKDPEPIAVLNVKQIFMGVELELANSYETPRRARRPKLMERQREWERFRNRVERLAA